MLAGEGRFSEAEARVRRAIEIDPSMPGAYLQLKTLLAYALNNFVAAVRLAESLMAQLPSDPSTQLKLVDLYLRLGDLSRAGDCRPALDSIRDDPEFKAIVAGIERDMTRQLAELAKQPKVAPLDLYPSR